MFAYVLRRLLISVPVLIASTFIVFLIVTFSGDPLSDFKQHQPPYPPATIKLKTHQLFLDKPVLDRYYLWIKGLIVHGNFGPSTQDWNIGQQLGTRFFVTLRLIALAMVLAVLFAIIVGVITAVKQYSAIDYAATFTGFLFLSLPVFWFAILLKEGGIWINNHVGRTIFYTIGDKSVLLDPGKSAVVDSLEHLILPTIVLAMTSYASWSRFQRGSMLEVLNSDYIRLARAKGLSRSRVMVRHALRTALIPLTTVTALDLAGIIGGAVITETVFQWHGMGEMLLSAITHRDVYAVLAWLLIAAVAVILFNLVADLLYAVLDPRIRYE